MHLISARAERAYSRSILKRLKMSQTLSSANTFQIHTKNISSDNTHLRFSSRRAHTIEEEIQVYSHPRVHFRERAEERNRCFLLATRATRRSVLRRLSSRTFEAHRRDNTHLRFSSRRAHHKIEEETCRYILSSTVACSLLRVHRRGTNWFLLATRATKIFKNASDF